MSTSAVVGSSVREQEFLQAIKTLLLIVGISQSVPPLYAATLIDVPPESSDALMEAVHSANQSSDVSIIRLASGAVYDFNLPSGAPETISSHIILLGEGSDIVGNGEESFGHLFEVSDQGILEVSDLVIRDFESDEDRGEGLILNEGLLIAEDVRIEHIRSRSSSRYTNAIFENSGRLELNRVRVTDITVRTSEVDTPVILAVANRGDALLENVLIADSKGLNSKLAKPFGDYVRNVNLGILEIRFSSLILDSTDTGSASDVQALVRNPIRLDKYAPGTTVSASMIMGFECPFKQSDVSGGFNVVSAESCEYQAPTDRLGVDPLALNFRMHSDGGVKIALPPQSPAVDRVNNKAITCPSLDAIGSSRLNGGDPDELARCDAGAFEYSGGNLLFAGGENGLFYSAGADGHYVTIQEVRPKEYVIFWNTFDLDGNQVWVLAVGEGDGDTITADGYYQSEGKLIPGGGANVNTDGLLDWGTISIQLENCLKGEFSYDSKLAQFRDGTFEIDRLAYVNDLGCQNLR